MFTNVLYLQLSGITPPPPFKNSYIPPVILLLDDSVRYTSTHDPDLLL